MQMACTEVKRPVQFDLRPGLMNEILILSPGAPQPNFKCQESVSCLAFAEEAKSADFSSFWFPVSGFQCCV